MPGTAQSKTPSATPAVSFELARATGCDCANEWLNHLFGDGASTMPANHASWRAICYAEEVRAYKNTPDFLPQLAAWEQGFDSTMNAATAVQTRTASESQHDIIKRLAGDANTVAALLFVVEMLPAEGRQSAMNTCYSIAVGIVDDLDEVHFDATERGASVDAVKRQVAEPMELEPASIAKLQELATTIEAAAAETKILLDAVNEKLEQLSLFEDAASWAAINASHCFLKCAGAAANTILAMAAQVIAASDQLQGQNAGAGNLAKRVGGAA